METLFRLRQMIQKETSIFGASLRFGMASYGLEHTRLPPEEGQPFVTGNSQEYQAPVVSYNCNYTPASANVIRQVARQPATHGCNYRHELDGSHQVPLQRLASFNRSLSWRRRKGSNASETLQGILCWVVTNIILTCGVVIGLLFLLKYLDSPLLRSAGRSDFTETLLIQSSDQKACVTCPDSERRDDESSSKLSKCCTANQEALQKLIEKITKETIRQQLPETPHQRNISDGQPMPKVGQDPCGALFFLYDDPYKDAATTKPGSDAVLRGWSADGNVAYKRPCINYDDTTGEVTINRSGFYLVYSHLAFIWNGSKDPSSPPSTILGQQIRVKMYDIQMDDPIAKDTRAIQPTDPKVGNIPSYNSRTLAIVHLQSGTKLTVTAKPSDLVMRHNAISSFGLYRL